MTDVGNNATEEDRDPTTRGLWELEEVRRVKRTMLDDAASANSIRKGDTAKSKAAQVRGCHRSSKDFSDIVCLLLLTRTRLLVEWYTQNSRLFLHVEFLSFVGAIVLRMSANSLDLAM